MNPRSTPSAHDDLFRARLGQILDPQHPLIRLADKIDWGQIDEWVGQCYAEEGRPGLSPRLTVGLHYLKHAFDESDELVFDRWVENPPLDFGNTSATKTISSTATSGGRSTCRV